MLLPTDIENSTKLDTKQLLLILNHAEQLLVEVRSLSHTNYTGDSTMPSTGDEAEQIDRLRNAEIIIIICVLLLWCGSIYIFIRHSELLRIRYRAMPYNPSTKVPLNHNHMSVHRLSEAIIQAKPASTSITTLVLTHSMPNRISEQGSTGERKSLSVPQQPWHMETNMNSFESNPSIKYNDTDDNLLDPQMIPRDVRRRLLDLHRKSVDNLAGIRYSVSFPGNDLSIQRETTDEEQQNTTEEDLNDQ